MLSYIISQFILTTRLGRRSRRSEHWIPTPACAGAPQLVPESGLKAGHWPRILVPSSSRGSSRGPHRPGPRPPGLQGSFPPRRHSAQSSLGDSGKPGSSPANPRLTTLQLVQAGHVLEGTGDLAHSTRPVSISVSLSVCPSLSVSLLCIWLAAFLAGVRLGENSLYITVI